MIPLWSKLRQLCWTWYWVNGCRLRRFRLTPKILLVGLCCYNVDAVTSEQQATLGSTTTKKRNNNNNSNNNDELQALRPNFYTVVVALILLYYSESLYWYTSTSNCSTNQTVPLESSHTHTYIVSKITLGPAKPIRAPLKPMRTSACIAYEALTPP